MKSRLKTIGSVMMAMLLLLIVTYCSQPDEQLTESLQTPTQLIDPDDLDDGDFLETAAGTVIKYKVFSPVSGSNWGQATNCTTGSTHNPGINGLTNPIDIGATANADVRFYCNPNITSIRTIRTGPSDDGDRLCSQAATPPAGFEWVNEGVKVELFNAAGTKVGVVFYGHLRNRIANGVYSNPSGLKLGNIGNQDCNCKCYDGFHVHMESSGNGKRKPWNCYAPLNSSTVIYKFRSDRPL